MNEEIFKQQIEVIFQPKVLEYMINGKSYLTYSQAIPAGAETYELIEFYLIIFLDKEVAEETQNQNEVLLDATFKVCVHAIMIGLAVTVLVTMIVAYFTGWRIQGPVKDMTNYTKQMKVAPSLAMKISIVKKTA